MKDKCKYSNCNNKKLSFSKKCRKCLDAYYTNYDTMNERGYSDEEIECDLGEDD